MTGFLLLFLIVAWAALLVVPVRLIVRFIKPKPMAIIMSSILSVVFMCIPVYDEVIGGFQFREICRKSVLEVNEENSRNKTVYLKDGQDENLTGYYVPIRKQDWIYIEINSGEPIVSWSEYYATGGKLIRFLGISETNAPLTFNGVCYPKESGSTIFKRLNITKKNRKEVFEGSK